ncbi:hypothetical protein FJZ36_08320 [Candidatus Poribacteria bacterium]|nr:hypothetical protein [Candidatus Poribacteria bacterium]
MEMIEARVRTTDELFSRLESLVEKDHDLLTRLDIKVGEILSRMVSQEARFDDHEKRLRELEAAKWRIAGIAAVLSTLMPVLISLLTRAVMGGG